MKNNTQVLKVHFLLDISLILEYYIRAFSNWSIGPVWDIHPCRKFGKKAMVWQAIWSCGKISQPFVTTAPWKHTSGTAAHDSKPQGSCYRLTCSCNTKNVSFIPKEMDPPNCPQFQPIEEFWALAKAHLRKHILAEDIIQQFKKDWKKVKKTLR